MYYHTRSKRNIACSLPHVQIKINVFGPTADQATFTSVPGVTQTPGANSHLDAMSASSSASAPLTALLGLCVAAVLAL